MAAYWSAHPMPADVVVPVPLYPARLKERGFNQAALLARELAQQSGLAMNKQTLIRHRSTASQVGLDAEQRKENVRNAFRCTDDALSGKRVLVIDDVCTTGSTLGACAAALHAGGADSVRALTLAHAR